ncbi:TPA: hypothetical protein N3A45_001462 [Salmonella enterica subsp. salamae serovar [1],40:z35:e,n,x,z15]|nr:hypothetical protein [Salmonella enterica]HCM1998388.1 hypothetical protein [Salmonella enterica subsp. salamae serovar [1],40:z35:e,n,x,z15]
MFRLIGIVFLFFSAICHAVLPSDIYRRDTRGPDIIFSEGFLPRGSNTDLLQHVSGASLRGDNGVPLSTWVSASASLRWTTTPRYPITEFWVYTITPDSRAYSVELSFEHYINSHSDSAGASFVRRLLDIYGEQHEWSVLGGIPASSVRFATRYIFASGEFIAVEMRQNPNYRSSIPAPNPDPYPLLLAPGEQVNAIGGRAPSAITGRWTGLSLSACWGAAPLSREKRDTDGIIATPACSISAERNITHGTPMRNASIMSVTTMPWIHDEF